MRTSKSLLRSKEIWTSLRRFFCVAIVLAATACEKSGSPDWDQPGKGSGTATAAVIETPATPAVPAPVQAPKAKATPTADSPSDSGLRFITYNVKNWLKMDRYVDRQSLKNSPKPDTEKSSVIAILARHSPDVVGLCEIGTAEDLADIQQLLKAAGLDLPHSHYTGGSDEVRHLGILSRFPITATARPQDVEYKIQGKVFAINRGILDVTIDVRGTPFHFVGVHLKSKRDVEEGDQEEMRRAEARLLRHHVDKILEANPDERLIVYGDFNDTRSSNAGKAAVGSYNDPKYLTAIPAKDSVGTRWTHFWALHDIYSRIDFVTVSKALKPDTDFESSKILDDADWEIASDHRPILAIFR